jgi:hypothetical protein
MLELKNTALGLQRNSKFIYQFLLLVVFDGAYHVGNNLRLEYTQMTCIYCIMWLFGTYIGLLIIVML